MSSTSILATQAYKSAPLRTRLFIFLRWHLTPYRRMVTPLPHTGKILDLGCGHGLFALTMGVERPGCQVLGLDHDAERIELARGAGEPFKNVSFQVGDLRTHAATTGVSAITLIDTLHYLSDSEQIALVKQAFTMLTPGGVFLVREVDQTGGLRATWNKFYEKIATTIKFTKTGNDQCHFRAPADLAAMLRNSGFSVTWSRCSSILFSDVLFIATKTVD